MKLTPAKFLYIVVRSWRVVVLFVTAGALISGAYLTTAYQYTSIQRIMVESQSTSQLQTLSSTGRNMGWGDTQREAELAIRKLRVKEFYDQVAAALSDQPHILSAMAIPKSRVIMQRIGLHRFVEHKAPPPLPIEAAAWVVSSSMFLRVDENDFVEIRVTHLSPFVASAVANAAAQVGREFVMSSSLKEIAEASNYIEQEINSLSEKIDEVDKQTALLSSASGGDGESVRTIAADQSQLAREILNAELEIETNQKIIQRIQGEPVADEQQEDTVISDATLLKVADLRETYERISILRSQGVAEQSFELSELDASAHRLEEELTKLGVRLESIRTLSGDSKNFSSIFDLERRNAYLRTFLDVAQSLLRGRVKTSVDVQELNLKREGLARYRQLLYRSLENLNSQLFEFRIKRISVTNKYSIGGLLGPGQAYRTPQIQGVMLFSIFSSMGMAVFLIILLNSRNPLVVDSSDLQSSGIRRLGELPLLARRNRFSRSEHRGALIASIDVVNEFKAIANRISRMHRGSSVADIMGVTSTSAGEGKSFVAFKLAQTLGRSQAGKTIIFDCDIMAPRLREYMNDVKFEQMSCETIGHLFKVYALSDRYKVALLQESVTYDELQRFFRESKDFEVIRREHQNVILDLPPIAFVPDAVPLLSSLKHLIFVVRSGRNRSSALNRVLAEIDEFDLKTSVVMNCMRSFLREDYGHSLLYGYGKMDKASKEYLVAPQPRRPAA